MYKISSQVIDYYDNQDLLVEILGSDMPESIKKANLLSHDQKEELPDDEFAVVIMTKTGSKLRKFPVNDKGHTWLSCKAFNKNAHKLPEDAVKTAASNLYSSCVFYGLECPKSIEKFATEITSNIVDVDESTAIPVEYTLRKVALEKKAKVIRSDQWGVTIKTASCVKNLYPLNTLNNVREAISYFQKHADSILPEYKRQFASNIVKEAANYECELSDNIKTYANSDTGSEFSRHIESRKRIVKTAEEHNFLSKLDAKKDKFDADTLISMVSDFDKIAGIDVLYGRSISDPYITVLDNEPLYKEAILERDGSDMYKDSDIIGYSQSDASVELRGHLPEETIDKFLMEPVKTYKSLPDVQKEVIKRGISGVIK